MMIFAGIVARLPNAIVELGQAVKNGDVQLVFVILILILFIAIIALVIYEESGQRKIPVHYAKRVVGRKMYGGQSSYIPLKVNQSGVMPVIFSMSILSLPSMIVTMFFSNSTHWLVNWFRDFTGGPFYYISYFILIIAFTFFYSMIQFNPVEISNSIQKNGGFIPGIRPGKPTTEYIFKTANRLNWADGLFLTSVCIVPTLIGIATNLENVWFAGTSVLILTGVANDLVVQIESQLVTRNYRGFLD